MQPKHNLERLVRAGIEASAAFKIALLKDARAIRLIAEVAGDLADAARRRRRIFLFGNGGSAADAQHLAAEFVGRFKLERPGLPAIALTVNTSCLTAIANDSSYDLVFARQLEALAAAGDVAIGISTSGNSANVVRAIECANEGGLATIGLTGRNGGKLRLVAQQCICAPSSDTARIQEMHILVGHILCEIVELELFGEPDVKEKAAAAGRFRAASVVS